MPVRLQASRRAGSKRPEGAVYVGRPSKWGNPHRLPKGIPADRAMRQTVVRYFELDLIANAIDGISIEDVQRELRGKDLVCWCPLDQPCHADVLLRVANAPEEP